MVIMRKEHNALAEEKLKEWQNFVIKNRDIFEQIAKGLQKRRKR